MRDTGQFYEAYWRWRRKHNRLDTDVRERVYAAYRFLNPDQHPKQRVLDIGCGEGSLGRLLREHAHNDVKLVGIDIAAAALALANPYYNHIYQVNLDQDTLAEHIGTQHFHSIVVLETLEHLFKPQAALIQMSKLLLPGGQLIASFPNIAWWRYRLKLLMGAFPEEHHIFDTVEHLHYFTLPSFRQLLTQSGFVMTAIDGEFLQPIGIRHLPYSIRKRLNTILPNLFGYQIVVQAVLRT